MSINRWIGPAIVVAALGCGTANPDFVIQNLLQRTVFAGTADVLTLPGGSTLEFSSATFSEDTVVVFSDVLLSSDSDIRYYPTATKEAGDLFAGLVVNTPADALLGDDAKVTFVLLQDATASAGQRYKVYRFDFENLHWNQWGSTTAEIVDAGGGASLVANATLPTTGLQGFIGSLALFDGMLADAVAGETEIQGTVVDAAGGGLSIDVAIYYRVGAARFPVAVINGRVPDDVVIDGLPVMLANTVDSDPDGSFTMQIPDNLIGQIVGFEFGREAQGGAGNVQDRFDLLDPPANPQTDVETMVIRFGENNIRSQPVT
ncbi:hypothetical protein IIA79_07950 [bacterium]|nr:hypothetical protein [bacterium]